MRIFISWGEENGRITRMFFSDEVYATEAAADDHGVGFAKRIIDGNIDLLSLG